MVDAMLVCEACKEKYCRYLLRCPAPGCGSAVRFVLGSENSDVTCKCSYKFCWSCIEEVHRPVDCIVKFCWSCIEEVHRPVDCSIIARWKEKNSSESENVAWILANSKPCPKCQRPIEKNHACMHMSCKAPCRYEFCLLCLGPWLMHGSNTGGNYNCNRYENAMKLGEYDKEVNKREMAKKYIEKYAHYYERWALNHKSMGQAVRELKEMQSEHIENLSIKLRKPGTELEFISDAWLQIIECRRVLKWSYAYGYYLPVHELVKKQFFEYVQGEAESGLERLHRCAEKELKLYLKDVNLLELFGDLDRKLKELTLVTGNYFKNLVRALENGLSDVHSEGTCSSSKDVSSNKEIKSLTKRTGHGWIPRVR
ncbi:hypothetical protein MKX01_015400 [Papaver californicum]|nr:hypothetical protein MKX01_015400 [Papaver californicum]